MQVSIIDYGAGNIISLKNALEHIGAHVHIMDKGSEVKNSDKLILPGVGAFGFGIKNLHERGLYEALTEAVLYKKRPILGICLGAQLMFKGSEETPNEVGLNWIAGTVKKIQSKQECYRVPHVGWDHTEIIKKNPYLECGNTEVYYYSHSYFMDLINKADSIAICNYSEVFSAAFSFENILGCQFHPEKSQKPGLNFLYKFLKS